MQNECIQGERFRKKAICVVDTSNVDQLQVRCRGKQTDDFIAGRTFVIWEVTVVEDELRWDERALWRTVSYGA